MTEAGFICQSSVFFLSSSLWKTSPSGCSFHFRVCTLTSFSVSLSWSWETQTGNTFTHLPQSKLQQKPFNSTHAFSRISAFTSGSFRSTEPSTFSLIFTTFVLTGVEWDELNITFYVENRYIISVFVLFFSKNNSLGSM